MPPSLMQTQLPQRRKPSKEKIRTVQLREFKALNLTDARTSIDDNELAWLENVMPIGKGALQIVPGPSAGFTVTGKTGVTLMGFVLNGASVALMVASDGSVHQITQGGVVTQIAAAATVSVDAHMTIWRDTNILIIDPTLGYFSWDGTTFSTLDAARLGTAIAVFEGRVWIANNRTITYSAPNSFSDFTAANGGGSTILTDEAFQGPINELHSQAQQLWVLGDAAIDTISNVQSSGSPPTVTTTFAVTNIVSNIGTSAPRSVAGYFRALVLMAEFGVYALSGVTPQKLSDKLDSFFDDLTLGDAPVAVATINSLPVLCFLVTYTGTNAQNQQTDTQAPIPILLCFTQGKWFLAVQWSTATGFATVGLTSVLVNGVSQAWTIINTGGNALVTPLFTTPSTAVKYKVQSKLYDFGLATTMKQLLKVGVEIQAEAEVNPTMTIDSESGSQNVSVTTSNILNLVNNVGATLTLLNALNQPLQLVAQGLVLSRQNANFGGRYLGFSIAGQDVAYRIQAVQMQIKESTEWWA